jgi:hypothetical protein
MQDKSLDHAQPKHKGVPGPAQHPIGSSCALLTISDTPSGFFLFPMMITLKRKRFQNNPHMQLNATWYLHAIQTTCPQNMLQSERIAGITVYNLEDRTLKDMT